MVSRNFDSLTRKSDIVSRNFDLVSRNFVARVNKSKFRDTLQKKKKYVSGPNTLPY